MSLRVWLPLNGNLENKGISNITFTNTATSYITVNTAGKIGSCFAFNSSANNNGIYSADNGFMANYINNKSWSICAWIKTSSIDTCIISLSYGLRMFAGNSTYISLYNSSRAVNCTSSIAVKDGNWHHVAATYNVSTNEIKFYVDGVNTGNATYTSGYTYASSWTNGIFIGKDPNNNTVSDHYLYKGSMNDVRIYSDECLSSAEVHDIAQGLVLHYKLDNKNIENTTNLYSGTFSNTCYNGATNKYSYGTSTDIYKTTGYFQGKDSVKIYMGTPGLDAYPYVYFDAFNTTGTAIHTLSFDYYPTTQTSIIPYSYAGNYNISYTTSNGNSNSYTNVSSVTIPVLINQWNHISITMQKYDTTNTTRGNGYIRIGSSKHTSTSTDYWLFANIQVEAKAYETEYTPPGTTSNNTFIQDSSGYNHNGTIVGTATSIVSNCPRYDRAVSMNNTSTTNHIESLENINFTSNITVSFWVKAALDKNQVIFTTKYIQFGILNQYGYVYPPKGTGAFVLSSYFISNEWNHVCVVNNDGTFTLYVNGQVVSRISTADNCYLHNSYKLWLLNRSYNANYGANAAISDFRIYCTPLLDTDIKSLYNIGMRIDNFGRVHTYELVESDAEHIKKSGQLVTRGLEEIDENKARLTNGDGWQSSEFIEI